MNTFFKTFFICLVVTFGFLAYKFFSMAGYSPELTVTKSNPIFGTHTEVQNEDIFDNKVNESAVQKKEEVIEKPKQQKYTHTCYFYSVSGSLTPVNRELSKKQSIESAITLLLKGPTIPETKKGIYSEIPANVDLISVKRIDKSVIVDLSSNFGNGGGTKSVENRVKQLAKTVRNIEPNKNIYLHINGKEVEYLGGDGVYIKQPLE